LLIFHLRQAHLADVIAASHLASRFTSLVNRWQQQASEYTDDGHNHQKLDQGETPS
jgi:hypothetical protein